MIEARYAAINPNDFVNGEGTCVSIWTQGCPHHCPGCFNPETWDFTKGKEVHENFILNIIDLIKADGVQRNLSFLGGEPLCFENEKFVWTIIKEVKKIYPNIQIFIWTGYYLQELQEKAAEDWYIDNILKNTNILIDGPFIQEQKDVTLKWRGSTNQHINVLNAAGGMKNI